MIDELFTLLAGRSRRRILVSLLDVRDEPVPVESVALTRGAASGSAVRARTGPTAGDGRGGAVTEEQALDHLHLPKLDESDLIDWDREAGTVARGPRFAEAESFLRLLARNQHELPGHLF
jgi:hypothetical protein